MSSESTTLEVKELNPTANNNAEDDDLDEDKNKLLYGIDDRPPWYICMILGFQHYLTMFGSTVAVPLILAGGLGITDNPVALGKLISTIFFVSGIVTILQTSLGNRLPIIQGGTFAFLAPALAILSEYKPTSGVGVLVNTTTMATTTSVPPDNITTTINPDVDWQERMALLQGSIMVASVGQILIGFTGLPGLLMAYIGPITIAPTVAMVGLGLWKAAADTASESWLVAIMTMALIIIFSQYLSNVTIPIPKRKERIPIFKLFPVFLAIITSWIICAILEQVHYLPKTDTTVLSESPWFRVPYPCQWGAPRVTLPAILGMLGAVLSSMIESIGDYYACARLCKISSPPNHAINRGILMEGFGCLIAGLFGTGNGTTSYSENVGAIGITRVGSRVVIQVGAIIMMVLAIIGKFGAVFTTIPKPVIGGMFFVMFGMITAVGLSSLKNVDLDSTRNLLIVGFSLFIGLSVPGWIEAEVAKGKEIVSTGVHELDQIILIFLKTSMFLSMSTAFFLDNTIPGSKKERGLIDSEQFTSSSGGTDPYLFPDVIQSRLEKYKILRKFPIFPKTSAAVPKKDYGLDDVEMGEMGPVDDQL